MSTTINLTLKVWRQPASDAKGCFETYQARDLNSDMSFLEMIEMVNEDLVHQGKDPIAFDHDCHEGICGTCGAVVNGQPHGPLRGTTLCQLHLRHFKDNDVIVIEPFRSQGFPVVKDLVVDRTALDRIIAAGGYISVRTGSAPEANFVPFPKEDSDLAMDAASCIGCGACVASCPNAAAMLFAGAKISHLALLPQGQPERKQRVRDMINQMDKEGFGYCTNHYECQAACPKEISVSHIARMNREFLRSKIR
jgi:succinate dehydrogenase / fumarate reductase iron-sulfur subunit